MLTAPQHAQPRNACCGCVLFPRPDAIAGRSRRSRGQRQGQDQDSGKGVVRTEHDGEADSCHAANDNARDAAALAEAAPAAAAACR